MRRLVARRGTNALLHLALLTFGALWVYPFVWMLFSSLKTNTEYIASGIRLLPESAQWSNFSRAWRVGHFSAYFANSAIVTAATVVIVVVLSALAGYALGRVRFPGARVLLAAFTATMFIPKGYTILPVYQLIKHLGLLNTMPGVILAESSGAHVLFILLYTAHFRSLPQELEESAEIDGSGFFRTFRQIMLPLSLPIVSTTVIMQFIWTWNSFFVPLIFTLNKPELRTLAVGMFSFTGENTVDWSGMAAGASISLIPVMVVFILFQRYFINGIAGSVKG
ncbi:carbohydrate ABC transporter permease [Cohnella zeiphila]|uniref:Carbohydrate ABC transporter permease n=1 Tax=Cohnella zeiphila TaxID=2761120 RepID=A0A7X0W0T6_9BACL|nr:carbohydrate ABC transporter permease [Cohnella zeiphila]MBB6735413.1 carbohydrate ABC transporter permease [Cohnella zeiphila]